MLRILKNNRAQSTAAEYMLVLGFVVAAVFAMTVYFRRAVQARLRDAEMAMVATAIDRTGPHYRGNWVLFYEPYYFNTTSIISRDDTLQRQLSPTTFTKIYDTSMEAQTLSDTASPRFYLNNLPTVFRTGNDMLPLP